MNRILVWLAATLLRFIGNSLRMTVRDDGGIFHAPNHPPVILAVWHNRLALMPYFYERYMPERPLYSLISLSRDGQFIADVAARFGIRAVRGSSSRKGVQGALQAIRVGEDSGSDLVITPDGPRGPKYKFQPGILRIAQATGRGIVVVTTELGWKKRLRSWDRFQVPLPFSTCKLTTLGPFKVPENASPEELDDISMRLAQMLGTD